MAVAFPISIGFALVLGVLLNYSAAQKEGRIFIFVGVALVTLAIIFNAAAYKKVNGTNTKVSSKGIVLCLLAGLLMSFFYRFIAASMNIENFEYPQAGKMTPYTAVFIFSVGIF